MQSPQPILASILIALMPVLALASSPLRQVLEVHLSGKLTEPAGWPAINGHPIIKLAFSPDAGKLAATMDDHYLAGVQKTHLLIVDLLSPQGTVRQFDLETCGKFLAWAPDGSSLLVCGRVLQLNDGSSCDLLETSIQRFRGLGNSSYWLTADRLIRADRTITNRMCQPVEKWAIEGNWRVAGAVPEKGWVLLAQSLTRTINGRAFPYNDYAMADRDAHILTSGMLLRDAYRDSSTIMAQGAAMVCSELVPAGQYKSG